MYQGIYEYCGIQRCGKSTLMVKDIRTKLLNEFKPNEIYSNFRIFIPGVNVLTTERLCQYILKVKESRERHKVFVFDECGQSLMARGALGGGVLPKGFQTEICSFAWQMPKRNLIMLYASNVGNSTDVILRDATWVTIMPKYFPGDVWEDDYIKYGIIYNYDCETVKDVVAPGVWRYQKLFDSDEPID